MTSVASASDKTKVIVTVSSSSRTETSLLGAERNTGRQERKTQSKEGEPIRHLNFGESLPFC